MKVGDKVTVDSEEGTVTREYSWKWNKVSYKDRAEYVRVTNIVLVEAAKED